jgi:predicted RNase H-like nuclease (RuvC/YqgF family)
MTKKRFDYNQYNDGFQSIYDRKNDEYLTDWDLSKIEELLNKLNEENKKLKEENEQLKKENKNLKAQLYSDEDGICNQCKYHYLVKDEDSELGYYKSRCRKGHYECARVSLVHCEDFEVKNGDVE